MSSLYDNTVKLYDSEKVTVVKWMSSLHDNTVELYESEKVTVVNSFSGRFIHKNLDQFRRDKLTCSPITVSLVYDLH